MGLKKKQLALKRQVEIVDQYTTISRYMHIYRIMVEYVEEMNGMNTDGSSNHEKSAGIFSAKGEFEFRAPKKIYSPSSPKGTIWKYQQTHHFTHLKGKMQL